MAKAPAQVGSLFTVLYTKNHTNEDFVLQAAGIGRHSRSPVARQALLLTSVVLRTLASEYVEFAFWWMSEGLRTRFPGLCFSAPVSFDLCIPQPKKTQ